MIRLYGHQQLHNNSEILVYSDYGYVDLLLLGPTRSQFTDSTETSLILVHQANLTKTSTGFKALSCLLELRFYFLTRQWFERLLS